MGGQVFFSPLPRFPFFPSVLDRFDAGQELDH
jgi:hypothetical protein